MRCGFACIAAVSLAPALPSAGHACLLRRSIAPQGVYTCFDYNYNPIARRILFVKVSESVARDEFMKLKGQLKTYDQLDEKEKRYYQYTCQPEDIIRICNIPSPTMTEEDLDMEKKLLTISK